MIPFKLNKLPYKIRNSVVLIVVLLIVWLAGYIINLNSSKQLTQLEQKFGELEQLKEKILNSSAKLGDESQSRQLMEELLEETRNIGKVIMKNDNSTATYTYIKELTDLYAPDMEFDFKLMNNGSINKLRYNQYAISGMAYFPSLYQFIYQIENQARLYTIENFTIPEMDIKEHNKVRFSLELRAYYNEEGMEMNEITLIKDKIKKVKYNPFFPIIHSFIIDDDQEMLLKIESAILIGLTKEAAFIKEKSGNILTLSPGDKVAYGYLSDINWDKQCVEFKINLIGIYKKQTLYMNKGKQ